MLASGWGAADLTAEGPVGLAGAGLPGCFGSSTGLATWILNNTIKQEQQLLLLLLLIIIILILMIVITLIVIIIG